MSYTALITDYKTKLVEKIGNHLMSKLNEDDGILFETMFQVSLDDGEYGINVSICEGMNYNGTLFGRDEIGDDREWTLKEMDVETLSYVLDQLLEVNYSVLQNV